GAARLRATAPLGPGPRVTRSGAPCPHAGTCPAADPGPQPFLTGYGSNAISLAFLMALATSFCSDGVRPVIRRARILPRSDRNLRSSAVSFQSTYSTPSARSRFRLRRFCGAGFTDLLLPTGLADARQLAPVRHLPQPDTRQPEGAVVRARPAVHRVAIADTGRTRIARHLLQLRHRRGLLLRRRPRRANRLLQLRTPLGIPRSDNLPLLVLRDLRLLRHQRSSVFCGTPTPG